VRQFLDTPVGDDALRRAGWSTCICAEWGNVQPWRIYVANGESMARLRLHLPSQPPVEAGEYDIYPKGLTEP
jgi:hypothetical protein